jgi:cation-transporting ATPase 13A1
VDVCCFDKTGTLTGEDLVLEGVSVPDADGANTNLIPATEVPKETSWVLASAHALVQLEDGVVGDPMEKETLKALQWHLGAHDTVAPIENEKGRRQNLQIRRRFQFSSALKRQSSVSNLVHPDFHHHKGFVAVKGAPETLKTMFVTIPKNYEETYKYFTRRGSRVLALGYKFIEDNLNSDQVR